MYPKIKSIISVLFVLLLGDFAQSSPQQQNSSAAVEKHNKNKDVSIVEVPYGKTITLICHSNDKNHNFLYWHLNERNTVVGPGNNFDNIKFQYEVLSGNLTIKAVSKYEEGLYNCVSRGVRNNDFKIRSVRMVVQQDWEEVYEHSSSINLFRIVIILGILIVLGGVSYFGYQTWKNRYRHPNYLMSEDEDEDSGDEIFRAPGTSKGTSSQSIIRNNFSDDAENPDISTDFRSILDTANNK